MAPAGPSGKQTMSPGCSTSMPRGGEGSAFRSGSAPTPRGRTRSGRALSLFGLQLHDRRLEPLACRSVPSPAVRAGTLRRVSATVLDGDRERVDHRARSRRLWLAPENHRVVSRSARSFSMPIPDGAFPGKYAVGPAHLVRVGIDAQPRLDVIPVENITSRPGPVNACAPRWPDGKQTKSPGASSRSPRLAENRRARDHVQPLLDPWW